MNSGDLDPFDAGAQIHPCVELPYCLREHEPDCQCDQRLDFERRPDPQSPPYECPECSCPCKKCEPDPPIGFVSGSGSRWVAVLESTYGGHTHMMGYPPKHLCAHFREAIAQWEEEFNADYFQAR